MTVPALERAMNEPENEIDDLAIELTRRHDSGLYGVVWEGRQRQLNRRVAVKIIRESMADAGSAVAHARALARVDHQNVVTVHQVGKVRDPDTDSIVDSIVMEWLDGQRLGDRLIGAKFTVNEARNICDAILDGLAAIHAEGIAHGDLHAGNVLLTSHAVKIIDIGFVESQTLARLSVSSKEARLLGDVEFARYLAFKILLHSEFRLTSTMPHEASLRKAESLAEIRDALNAVEQEDAKPNEQFQGWGVPDRLPDLVVEGYGLSGEAIQLLLEASLDPTGRVMHLQYMGGEHIQTNGKKFMTAGNPRSTALWDDAVKQLNANDLLELTGSSRGTDAYRVTTAGYDLADCIRAEMQQS